MRLIGEIILHCSASDSRKYDFDAIRKDHIENRGFDDIGYHFGIDFEGILHTLRPVRRIGAHCYGHNATSIGICVLGNSVEKFTKEQFLSLYCMLEALIHDYPNIKIRGHNEYTKTKTCPNFSVSDFCKKYGLSMYCPACGSSASAE